MNRYARIEARDVVKEGGYWCRSCQKWSEPDGEAAAANVCVRCGRPGLRWKEPLTVGQERGRFLFEQMRKAAA